MIRTIFVLILVSAGPLLAEDVLTVDFPIQTPANRLSDRLGEVPHQVVAPDGVGYTEISLLPMPEDQDLVVTVVFEEDGGKGPALFWLSGDASGQVTISTDLGDGVKGANQRSIQIPRAASAMPGKLIVQGDQSKILRVRMDWVSLRKVYAATDQKPVAFILSDRFLQNTELTGEKPLSPPDVWMGKILEASLQEEIESLGENMEFLVPLDQDIAQAVLSMKVLGLPLGQALEVWVNGTRVGQLQPAIPALSDAGYFKGEDGKTIYAGWRNGALYIPSDFLKVGENSIVLVAPGSEVFIRDTALQLRPSREATFVPDSEIVAGSF